MAFFRSTPSTEMPPVIHGDGIYLRVPQMADFSEWAILRDNSRAFLVPWEPVWPSDDLTRQAFRQRLRRYDEDIRKGLSYSFFIFESAEQHLVGGLTIADIRRGVAQSGNLGYWAGAAFAHRGFMTRAVRAIIPFCFDTLRLHRLEAACIPTNIASRKLLEKTGFQREGYAREYLCINGLWQDHLLYARLRQDRDPDAT
jgi:ribosomal-protein-alanine N-acetyltransferase